MLLHTMMVVKSSLYNKGIATFLLTLGQPTAYLCAIYKIAPTAAHKHAPST